MILDEIRRGCWLTENPDKPSISSLSALALRDRGRHKVLLINKTNTPVVAAEGPRG